MATEAPSDTPKAVLYWFGGSVWAAVPLLTAHEKGFTDVQLDKKVVNLLEGANFSPQYLKISPKGTVPALVAPFEHTVTSGIPTKFKAITNSIEISAFLDQSTNGLSSFDAPSLSPATVQGVTEAAAVVELVHAPDAPDPNTFLLGFRNEEERKAKYDGLVGKFLKGRQAALEKYSKEAGDEDKTLAAFYQNKIKENGHLLSIYEGKSDASDWIKLSTANWGHLVKTIDKFEDKLADAGDGFLFGALIALPDLHAGAFFARIFAVAGAKSIEDTATLEAQLPGGKKVGPKLKAYLARLFERESFKSVYADGLH
ncbi:hypothetical protein T439DRAFT_326679 [Meredithblackwellia eburnea MCA 4105]